MLTWASSEVVGYAIRIAKRNVWQFKHEMDFVDLLQEFAIAFLKAKKAYDPARGPAAFMFLYKQQISWTLASLRRRYLGKKRDTRGQLRTSAVTGFDDMLGMNPGHGLSDINLTLDDAPAVLRKYVRGVASGEFKQQVVDGRRENMKEAVFRFTGLQLPVLRQALASWWEQNIGPIPA